MAGPAGQAPDRLEPIRIAGMLWHHPVRLASPWARNLAFTLIVLLAGVVWLVDPWVGRQQQIADLDALGSIEPAAGGEQSTGEQTPDLLAVAAREIEARQAALDAREREVTVREEALGKLAASLRAELAELRAVRKERDEEQERLAEQQEERTARLARLYESMKPKKAASILDGMPTEDVANITRRMRDGKAAAVIQQMAPEQASALSAQLSKQ